MRPNNLADQDKTETSMIESIPASRGKAAFVARGKRIKVINTLGAQVVDTWAFNRADPGEFMSMEHSRATLRHPIRGIR